MAKKKSALAFEIGQVYDQSVADLPLQQRKDTLESMCYNMTEGKYTKQLNDEELAEKKSTLAEISIQIAEIEEEKKDAMKEFKTRLEVPTTVKVELLGAIKHKSEYREGILFHIDDQETGMMYIFDDNAECVDIRPLRREEKQIKMKSLNTGTDGE